MSVPTTESVMTSRFLRISTAHSLREALGLFLYGEERKMDTGVIVVINTEGEFAGILTPESLVRGLTGSCENLGESADSFLERVNQNLPTSIDTVMLRDLPRLTKETGFAKVILLIGHGEYECLPVMEGERVVGLVYATDVLKAAGNLALTPGQGGIDVDRK